MARSAASGPCPCFCSLAALGRPQASRRSCGAASRRARPTCPRYRSGGRVDFLILIVFGFALMWLLVFLPQRRRQATHDAMVRALKPGDYILTAGGFYGTVTEIGEDDVGVEIAPDVEVRVAKRAIGALIPPEEILDEEVAEPEAERLVRGSGP